MWISWAFLALSCVRCPSAGGTWRAYGALLRLSHFISLSVRFPANPLVWCCPSQDHSLCLIDSLAFPIHLPEIATYYGHHCCWSWVLCLLLWIKSTSGSEAFSFHGFPCPVLPCYDDAAAELGVGGGCEQFPARTPPWPCLIQSSVVFPAYMPLVSF